MRYRINKKGSLPLVADMVVGIVFLIIIVYIVMAYADIKRDHDSAVIQESTLKTHAARDLTTLLRMPMSDGKMVSEHIIGAYIAGDLEDATLNKPLTQAIYKFFNAYHKADKSTWTLTVFEEKTDNTREHYYDYNKIGTLGSALCLKDVSVVAETKLPMAKEDTKGLIIELSKCFT